MKTKFYLVIIILSIFKVAGFSQSGNFGENDALFWSFDPETNTLTISGEGDIPNYNLNDTRLPWYDYIENIQQVEIQDGVTAIGCNAFRDHTHLIAIIISNSVTKIKEGSFVNCQGLTSIVIPNSVTYIGEYAFTRSGLISIVLPDQITQICRTTFANCDKLQSIEIPNSVKEIGNWAFYQCTSLSSVKLSDSLNIIGIEAFRESGLISVDIPDAVIELNDGFFKYCKQLQCVKIPGSVNYLYSSGFNGCDLLTSIVVNRKTPPGILDFTPPFAGFNKANCTLYIPEDIDPWIYSWNGSSWRGFKAYRPISEYGASTPEISVNKSKTWIQDNKLWVEASQAARLQIYSIFGKLLCQEKIPAGITEKEIPKGIFIVVVDGKAEKVRNF
jgi:hypothetical protein